MNEATLNANNYIDIFSNPSKFHMCIFDRTKNIYMHKSVKHALFLRMESCS